MKNIKGYLDYLNEKKSLINISDIINKIKSGDLFIDATVSGYFITDGNDEESYSILPYDDNPRNGWYIMSDGYDEPIDKTIVNEFKLLFKEFGSK